MSWASGRLSCQGWFIRAVLGLTVFMTHPTGTHPSDGWKEVIS